MSGFVQQTAALDAAQWVAAMAANWFIQSALLIAAGLVAGRLLRGRGSAVQSAVYRTTLLAAALCPLASLALWMTGFSGWSLAMPLAYTVEAAASDKLALAAKPGNAPIAASPRVG